MLNGNECKNFLRKIGLGIKSKIFDFTLDNKIKQNLFNLYVTSKSSENTYYLCMGYFYMIADHIAKCLPCSQSHLCAPKNYYFENAKVYIDNNYSCNITINDIAKYLNIERSYLYKIFVSESGLSPIHFLTDYRLSKAVEMMEFSQLTITTIANSVGFYDISHFSRQFQKKYGITPGKYRKHIHDSENIPG